VQILSAAALAVYISCTGFAPSLGAQQERVNADSALVKKFDDGIDAYLKLRKAALSGTPPPAKVMKHGHLLSEQRDTANRIIAARSNAKQGDICPPDVAAELRRLLSIALSTPGAAKTRASLQKAERVPDLKVNQFFPDKLPQPSMPPTLLLNLPTLPPEVDYRLIGRALVLRDTTAGIVIDFVPDALPGLK
jgi:hypothetical protein